ncbi:hypothetical protein AAFF_G00185190 [Aldrovandia affinis]|uniref:Uncharacterized protein n=1 Tax=Aldrovandia affinis TaxID=143900 RepID=A0AAD7RK87_9TELE|nr:hypothetical protein AAFF_G00185190 [Aldrovandia affinis]
MQIVKNSRKNCSFDWLHMQVWQNHSLHQITKIQEYRAVVSTLLYGSWVLYKRHIRLLECFQQRCLRSIMNIRWQDYITNNVVLEKDQMPSMESILLIRQVALGRKGALRFDNIRHQTAEERRRRRKGTVSAQSLTQASTSHEYQCPSCHRTCSSSIGLFSHQHACRK